MFFAAVAAVQERIYMKIVIVWVARVNMQELKRMAAEAEGRAHYESVQESYSTGTLPRYFKHPATQYVETRI